MRATPLQIAGILFALLAASPALASSPSLGGISPRGGQRGTEMDLTFGGDRLDGAQEILLYSPGIAVDKIEVVNPQQLKVHVKIAPDCRLGEHIMRVRTAGGVTQLRTFFVGPFAATDEKEPNNDFASPQPVPLNTTVVGVVDNEDVDYFVVEAKAGQRISAEVEGVRLGGGTFFDPYVAILDSARFELSAMDDGALLLQDAVASVVAPSDGKYVIQIREASYGGNGGCVYRLHVGAFPRPRVVYPAGGPAGQDVTLQFLGDVSGPIAQTVKLPMAVGDNYPLFADHGGQTPPSANKFRVSNFANVLEAEPNDDPKAGTAYAGEFPIAFNGIIEKDGDVDFFRFKGKPGVQYDVHCYARRLRSPLDSILQVCNGDGGALSGNDDSGGPDSYLRVSFPDDKEYAIRVNDHLNKGGPEYVYRVEVTPVRPKLTMSLPFYDNNNTSQERQTIVVPKGNRFATLVRAGRADWGGELSVLGEGLPDGVIISSENMAANLDVVPVVFEATDAAPIAGKLSRLLGKPVDEKVAIQPDAVTFAQSVNLVPNGNDAPFYQAHVDRLAIAVAEEAPFKLTVVQPKAPLVQNGSMGLKIVAERKADFTDEIKLQLLFEPPGVGAGRVEIPAGQNEVVMPLNANGGAQVRKWKTCVLGRSGGRREGRDWVSTPLFDLEIAEPFVTAKIELAATEQAKPAQVLCNLEQKVPFEGKAKVQLVGLPPNATTVEKEITSADKQVVFDVATTDKTPTGQHNTLFCVVTVTKDGEPVVHNIGQGGVLRVDAPPPPVANAPPPAPAPEAAPAPPPAGEPVKVLSRLEKLRLEQAAKHGK